MQGDAHLQIGQRKSDDSVKAAWPREGRIQCGWSVCGRNHNHTSVVLKAIHLCQQLIDGVHRLCKPYHLFQSWRLLPTKVLCSKSNEYIHAVHLQQRLCAEP